MEPSVNDRTSGYRCVVMSCSVGGGKNRAPLSDLGSLQ